MVRRDMVAAALLMTDEQRAKLEEIARSGVLPHRKVVQAKTLLRAGERCLERGERTPLRVTSDAVRRWRKRFHDKGLYGVGTIAKGRGRKP